MTIDRFDPPDPRGKRDQRGAWEAEYAQPHPLWRGPGELEAGLPGGGALLELGCGNGKTLAALGPLHPLVVAVDFSRNALLACARLEGKMPQLRLVQADMTELPFPDDLFDLVLCYHVLDHALEAERRTAAREVVRVTRSGGTISFRGFAVEDLRSRKGAEVEPRTYARGRGLIYHYFDEREVEGLFPGASPTAVERRTRAKTFHGKQVERVEIAASYLKTRGGP
jgi:SAM-dependent methyltransferase